MKDNMKPCQHSLANDVVYKEVVIIGNGPSGMVTSFMLAGNVPYLKEIPEDLPIDEMLRARLSNIPSGQSLYDVDLMELAEGLEGRSQNPVSILMDVLTRPCTDLGIQADSLIEWKYEAEKQVSHVVLGRGPPGGAWHTFPGDVRTLSPGAWLSLPPHPAAGAGRLPARAVAKYCRRYVRACRLEGYFRSDALVTGVTRTGTIRTPCAPNCPLAARFLVTGYDTAQCRPFRYLCRRVVVATGGNDRPNRMEPYIEQQALHSLADLERAVDLLANRGSGDPPASVLVVGSGVSGADAVRVARRARLLACHLHRAPAPALAALDPRAYPDYAEVYKMMCEGSSGKHESYKSYPNHVIVDVIPENDADKTNLSEDIEQAIRPKRVKLLNLVTNEMEELTVAIVAVVIGSKPDLFFLQTNFNINSIDIKNDCNDCKCIEETKLSKRKMQDENQRQCFLKNHWTYIKSILEQSIQSCKMRYLNLTEINGNDTKFIVPDDKKSKLISKLENGVLNTTVEISDSDYEDKVKCTCQPMNPYSDGIGFGLDPNKPVDCRSNPVAVNKATHEVLNGPKGLYALGPLTADNFIRFLPGGALAAVAHIHKEQKLTTE